jgi:hypothetical protein
MISTSKKDISSLIFYITGIYIRERNESNLKDLTEELANDYIEFLDATIELYQELITFINRIKKKKIMVFIKMLD